MKKHNIDQNSLEWDELRKGRITTSKFDVLYMKESTKGYKEYAQKIAYERMTNESFPGGFSGNSFTEEGHEREQTARELYEQMTFQKVHPGGFFELDKWVGSSPDGLIETDGLLEIKNIISGKVFMNLVNNSFKPTREQLNQCYGQMYVTERKHVDLMHIHIMQSGKSVVNIQRIERDEEIMKDLSGRIKTFKESVKEEMEVLKPYIK